MTKTIASLFKDFIPELKLFSEEESTINNKNMPLFIRCESKVAFNNLNDLFNNQNLLIKEVTPETLKIFQNFLSWRWSLIYKTDCSYNITPNSSINKVCLKLAQILAVECQKIAVECQKKAYDYLMPTVAFEKAKTGKKNIYEYQLNEFVIGKGRLPITLDYFFKALKNNDYINSADECLISKHGELAEKYYTAIKTDKNDLKVLKKNFFEALVDEKYNVQSTYGKSGEQRLIAKFIENLSNLKKLTNFLCKYLEKKDWLNFLKQFTSKNLFNVILNLDNLHAKNLQESVDKELVRLTKIAFHFKTDKELMATMICFLKVYYIVREQGEEYNSFFGRFVSIPKSSKLAACKMLMNFILADTTQDLNKIDDYINESKLKHHMPALLQHLNLHEETLPSLFNFLKKNAKQFARKDEKKEKNTKYVF